MKRQLILVHGAAQENKTHRDQGRVAFRTSQGLAKNGKTLPFLKANVRSPVLRQTLYDLIRYVPAERGGRSHREGIEGRTRRVFTEAILTRFAVSWGLQTKKILDVAGGNVVQKGLQNKKWVLGILRAIDQHVRAYRSVASRSSRIRVSVHSQPGVRDRSTRAVHKALSATDANVVVSHSLGTIVAYALITREGKAANGRCRCS